MIRTNKDSLVKMAVLGEISPPKLGRGYRPDNAGRSTIPIAIGTATWAYYTKEHKKRAKNGTRTRDPDLGKVVLYQLSYFRLYLIE